MILLTITIIIFIFILFFIIYHNLFRYALLHFDFSDQSYISTYMDLPRVNYPQKVIVSLTSNPQNIHKIKPMIKSILHQSVRVDQIALNLPPSCDTKTIPPELHNMVNIYNCGRNYGSGNKCIPTILRENHADTLLILLDENYIYPHYFIEEIIQQVNLNPQVCFYAKGVIVLKCGFVKEDIVDITKENVNDKTLMRYITAPTKQYQQQIPIIKIFT